MDQKEFAPLRVVPAAQPSITEQRVRIDRPLVYERIMKMLGPRVQAAHAFLRERGHVMPAVLPRDRDLDPAEVDELVWRVYALASALRLSYALCHPSVVLLAAEWWSAPNPAAWEELCEAHRP